MIYKLKKKRHLTTKVKVNSAITLFACNGSKYQQNR